MGDDRYLIKIGTHQDAQGTKLYFFPLKNIEKINNRGESQLIVEGFGYTYTSVHAPSHGRSVGSIYWVWGPFQCEGRVHFGYKWLFPLLKKIDRSKRTLLSYMMELFQVTPKESSVGICYVYYYAK